MGPPGRLRLDGYPDMRYSCNRSWAASSGISVPLTTGGTFSSSSSSSLRHYALVEHAPQRLRADGNPDLRYKANKEYVAKHGLDVQPTTHKPSGSSVAKEPFVLERPVSQRPPVLVSVYNHYEAPKPRLQVKEQIEDQVRTKTPSSAVISSASCEPKDSKTKCPPDGVRDLEIRMGALNLRVQKVSKRTVEIITDNYKETIGRGGFSQVFKGKWEGRNVAVKELRSNMRGTSGTFVKMVEGELVTLSRLVHDNIVSLLAYSIQCFEPDIICASLIFEHISGGTLFDRLFTSDLLLHIDEVILIALHTAKAMEVLHGRNLVHRDVKSSNILLQVRDTRVERAVLADFGLARLSSQLNDSGPVSSTLTGVVGTPGYIDPEYAETNQVVPDIDIYALGVVLFEMFWREKAESLLARRARQSSLEQCVSKAEKKVAGFEKVHAGHVRLAKRCVSIGDRPDAAEMVIFFGQN